MKCSRNVPEYSVKYGKLWYVPGTKYFIKVNDSATLSSIYTGLKKV